MEKNIIEIATEKNQWNQNLVLWKDQQNWQTLATPGKTREDSNC